MHSRRPGERVSSEYEMRGTWGDGVPELRERTPWSGRWDVRSIVNLFAAYQDDMIRCAVQCEAAVVVVVAVLLCRKQLVWKQRGC